MASLFVSGAKAISTAVSCVIEIPVSSARDLIGIFCAKASPMFAGMNAAASPQIELALINRRRDLFSGAFMECSLVLNFEQTGRRVDHNTTGTPKQSDEGIGDTL